MNDELYTLYKTDDDFKEYVDHWCKNHDIEVSEALRFNILQEYAKYLKERKNK